MSKEASPNQLRFLRSLVSERSSQFPDGVDAFMVTIENKRITSVGASGAIDTLLRIPSVDPKPVDPTSQP